MNAIQSPLFVAMVAALLAVVAARFSRRRLQAAAVGLVFLCLGLATPLGANFLVRVAEAPRPAGAVSVRDACPDTRTLVFLSGGMRRPARDARDIAALTPETLDRVLALRASGLPEELTLIISGGGPFRVKEAEIIAALVQNLGIEASRVLLEARSISTRTSAVEVARISPPAARRIILATSALHLPRAAWTFRRAGFDVCPWPLNSRYLPVRGPAALLPQSSSLDKSEWALYELLGQVYYRLTIRPATFDDQGRVSATPVEESDARTVRPSAAPPGG